MIQKILDLILKLHRAFEWYNWYSRKKKKGSCEFDQYVKDMVKQKGFALTEEEEKMVQDAIARRLAENKDSGIDLDDPDIDAQRLLTPDFFALEVEEVFS